MNSRFIKFLIALSSCLLGLYCLLSSLLSSSGSMVEALGVQLPQLVEVVLFLLSVVAGVLLARQAIIEELSVTSD